MKTIQIYKRRLDGEIIASTKPETHKYIGEVKEGETFKVLFRDDEPILTSFEANLEDKDFLESYTKKDYDDQLKNAEPEESGLGCSYYVVKMKVEFQDVNCFGEEIWTVEYANSYYYWGKVYAELKDRVMDHKYVLMYVSENKDVLDIETDDFEEVKSVVNEWMWKYSDGHIWVVGGKKVIKHIILTEK